ncbi:pirin family protein [Thiobacillus denitrificans]|uniref:pirin family protein n=1 Tax=Thiobacillus denitrificans TaxID=36861 RepID=UPI00035DD772|nr:pirin family protein [Thiobacillus denitrificans]
MALLTSREIGGARSWGAVRALNHDRWRPGFGFGLHGHGDLEIVSYVISGALEHKDSLGNRMVLKPYDVQVMSSGSGIMHSEFSHSATEGVEFAQIWISPKYLGLPPAYQRRSFSPADMQGRLRPLVSRDRRGGSLNLWQDVCLYAAILGVGQLIEYPIGRDHNVLVYVLRGGVQVNGTPLRVGESIRAINEGGITLKPLQKADILLFDLGAGAVPESSRAEQERAAGGDPA